MTHCTIVVHMAITDELLTSSQAGVILNRSPRTVARLAEAGEIPTVGKLPGPNGHYLFSKAAIEALAAERAEASA